MADVYMAGDLRNGTTFEMDGSVYKVVEFQHVKPGKGAAFVRTKLKNVINGSVLEKTFNPSEKLQGAEIEKTFRRRHRTRKSAARQVAASHRIGNKKTYGG